VVSSTRERITDAGLSAISASLLPPGTVLFSSRATIGKIGIAAVPLATNQGFANLIPSKAVLSKFLAYSLLYYREEISRLAGSTTFKEVRRGALKRFQIPLPPLSEQRRIVEILDQADALRKKRAEADAKAARILPALFYKMFGDPATNPKGWRKGRVGDVVIETQYGTSVRASSVRDGVAVVRMNNIDVAGRLDLSELKYAVLPSAELTKYALRDGDVLFNRTNSKELVGKTGLWRGEVPAVAASYLIRVRVDEHVVRPAFLWAIMNTRFMKQLLLDKSRRAIGMANINAQELRALPIIIPPLALQQAFELSLLQIERLATDYSAARLAMERLFSGLLHRALTGDLTARWRLAHMKELLAEMEAQARTLEAV